MRQTGAAVGTGKVDDNNVMGDVLWCHSEPPLACLLQRVGTAANVGKVDNAK